MQVRMVSRSSALTGRIGWHSTSGLAVVAAASLAAAQLDERVGRGNTQLGGERGVAAGPVGDHGCRARPRLWFLAGNCHNANLPTRRSPSCLTETAAEYHRFCATPRDRHG